jgi:heparosan-N-sulfate-glucuronate 5-epimerase
MRDRTTGRIRFAHVALCVGFVVALVLFAFGSIAVYSEAMYVPRPLSIKEDSLKATPGHYWIDLSERKYTRQRHVFDRQGVPMFVLNERQYYHPVFIGEYALGAYDRYLDTGDTRAREAFLRCANWFRENLVKRGAFHYWEYQFLNKGHEGTRKVPWFSAMAQGVGVSVLVRAFAETGNENYIVTARAAIEPIFHDIAVGGASVVGHDYMFPQEFLSDHPDPPSNILNGAIAAFFGVYDFYRTTSDPAVKEASDTIVRTFAAVISRYDNGYWSLYCQWPGHLATPHYHAVHVAQLKALYLISGEESFLRYAKKFEAYQKRQANRLRYVIASHVRRVTRFTLSDAAKIPGFVERLLNRIFS